MNLFEIIALSATGLILVGLIWRLGIDHKRIGKLEKKASTKD